jgi:MEMO1 family protein
METRDNPKLRWIEVVPTTHEGRNVFVVRDPEGLTDNALIVSRDVLYLLSLMDGTRTIEEIQAAYLKTAGSPLPSDRVVSVIETMDEHYLLLNERYKAHLTHLKEEYLSSPFRQAYLAGRSYPGNAEELRTFLSEMLMKGDDVKDVPAVKGMVVPHIDYGRGVEVYAPVYRYLPKEENTLFVIFGTCHKPAPGAWNISLKDLRTPLGLVRSAGKVGELIRQDRLLKDYVDEWPHRNEHSIELQIPVIQFLMEEKPFEVLSILTGSLHEYMIDGRPIGEGEVKQLVDRLAAILKEHEGPCVIIAAADLAHIGAQFGDKAPLDSMVMEHSRQKDEELLRTVEAVNARAFFDRIREEGDRRRICGLAPIYFTLSMLGTPAGQVIAYRQWTDDASSVSFAGVVFS